MQTRLRNIASLLLIANCIQTNGQNLLQDTIKARRDRGQFIFIIVPPYYDKLSTEFDVFQSKDTSNLSFRLWAGSMLGYTLRTYANYIAKCYSYNSDTNIKQNKIKSKITTTEFISRLKSLHIDKMISQYEINNFTDNVDDGNWYTLEIMNGRQYKVLQYHSPYLFKDPDNRKFAELIDLCDKYFHSLD